MSASLRRHAAGLTWTEPGGQVRSAHALATQGRVWLIDPFEDPAALDEVIQLGDVAGVIQLLDRHNRDCGAIAQRLQAPLHYLPDHLAGAPFEVVPVIARRGWREIALWWPQERTLVASEALGSAPAFAAGRSAGVHPLLRLSPPRARLSGYDPQLLLVGHGEPVEQDAADAVNQALDHARSDLPRLLIRLPGLLRRA